MRYEKSILSELSSCVEVNLEAKVSIQSENQRPVPVEVLVLSLEGGILRADFTPSIGDSISLLLGDNPNAALVATVKNYLNWSDSKKVFLVKFLDLNQNQTQALKQTVDYFIRLKKAGVRLGP
ncbi:MAG: hypothetical protein EBQ92_11865 [Proteobacteria bacterium]|nr:hypothetical protein [Pseudomonadota bacterium]